MNLKAIIFVLSIIYFNALVCSNKPTPNTGTSKSPVDMPQLLGMVTETEASLKTVCDLMISHNNALNNPKSKKGKVIDLVKAKSKTQKCGKFRLDFIESAIDVDNKNPGRLQKISPDLFVRAHTDLVELNGIFTKEAERLKSEIEREKNLKIALDRANRLRGTGTAK